MIIYNYYDYDIHSFIHSFIHSLTHSLTHSFKSFHSFIQFHFISFHSFIHSFMHSFLHSFHSFIHSFMSCHVMSCHVMSCHVMSCHVMYSFIHSFMSIHSFIHFISFHSFIHSISFHFISFIHSCIHSFIHSFIHVMSCHVMSCHVMSCHVMSCHVMSFIHSFHSFISFHFISFIHAFIHSFNHDYPSLRIRTAFVASLADFDKRYAAGRTWKAKPPVNWNWVPLFGLKHKKDMKCLAEPIPQFFTAILHPGTSAWQWAAWTGWTGPSRWHKSLCRYLWCCWVQDGAVWVKQQKYLLCLYMILVIPLMVTLQRNCATGKCLLRSVPKWLMAKNHTEWISVMLLSWSNSRLAASHLFRKSFFAHLNPHRIACRSDSQCAKGCSTSCGIPWGNSGPWVIEPWARWVLEGRPSTAYCKVVHWSLLSTPD